jgi:hypothetical protein
MRDPEDFRSATQLLAIHDGSLALTMGAYATARIDLVAP